METIDPVITRDIYPMPAFVTYVVADLEATVGWFTEALDFISLFTMPGPDGAPALVHLRRWRYQDVLVRARRPDEAATAPATLGSPTFSVYAQTEELDGLAQRARAHPAGSVEGPIDTPWNSRDLTATGPEGITVVFTARRPDGARDPEFNEYMVKLAREQGL